jgi:DNA mismatch endonuclease (patch repair protein)
MADRLTPQARSANMARIRARDTGPEIAVRKALHAAGFRFRLHRRDLPGTSDIVLVRRRIAIFVHGCNGNGRGARALRNVPGTERERGKPMGKPFRGTRSERLPTL